MKDGQQGAGVRGKSRAIRAGFGARTLVAIACSVLLAFVVGACGDDKGASNENANWMSPDGELGGSPDQVGSSVAGDARPSDGALTDKGKAPDEIAAPARPAPRVLFLGDSLAAGLHLPANEAFPAVLQERLDLDGIPFDLVNAGVSGDTLLVGAPGKDGGAGDPLDSAGAVYVFKLIDTLFILIGMEFNRCPRLYLVEVFTFVFYFIVILFDHAFLG